MEAPSVPLEHALQNTTSTIHSKKVWQSNARKTRPILYQNILSPFLIQSGMRRAVGGKPVIRGYWIVIGCNAGQGSYNAGQGSNRILPNCPFCQRHNPPARFHHPPETSRIRLVTSHLPDLRKLGGYSHPFPIADQLRCWDVPKFPKVETMAGRWWYKYFLFRRGNKSTE